PFRGADLSLRMTRTGDGGGTLVERTFRIGLLVLVMAAGVGYFAARASAQGLTAQISGTVLDHQKALVPGATVTARNTATQTVREAVTNDVGAFVLTNILAGT